MGVGPKLPNSDMRVGFKHSTYLISISHLLLGYCVIIQQEVKYQSSVRTVDDIMKKALTTSKKNFRTCTSILRTHHKFPFPPTNNITKNKNFKKTKNHESSFPQQQYHINIQHHAKGFTYYPNAVIWTKFYYSRCTSGDGKGTKTSRLI